MLTWQTVLSSTSLGPLPGPPLDLACRLLWLRAISSGPPVWVFAKPACLDLLVNQGLDDRRLSFRGRPVPLAHFQGEEVLVGLRLFRPLHVEGMGSCTPVVTPLRSMGMRAKSLSAVCLAKACKRLRRKGCPGSTESTCCLSVRAKV